MIKTWNESFLFQIADCKIDKRINKTYPVTNSGYTEVCAMSFDYLGYSFKKCNSVLEGTLIPPPNDVSETPIEIMHGSYDYTYTITWCEVKTSGDTEIENSPTLLEEHYEVGSKSSTVTKGM